MCLRPRCCSSRCDVRRVGGDSALGCGRRSRRWLHGSASRRGCRTTPADTALFGFALKVAHVVFERVPQVPCGAAKFSHHFAEVSSQFRQLLRAEDDQHNYKENNEMGDAEHFALVWLRLRAVF